MTINKREYETFWQSQYKRQFKWLNETRNFLYRNLQIGLSRRILEPGCSSALITEEISNKIDGTVVGLDRELNCLLDAKKREEKLLLVCGDIYHSPFKEHTFDSVIFQFLFLWLKKPFCAIKEMKRVLTPEGWIVSVGEPDYGGRIDFPEEIDYSSFIISKLLKEGADPFIGRKMEYIFRKSSLVNIRWDIVSIPFGLNLAEKNFEEEWKFIEKLSSGKINKKLKTIKKREMKCLKEKKRAYFMPVFYTVGKFINP